MLLVYILTNPWGIFVWANGTHPYLMSSSTISQFSFAGEILPIITVLQFPIKLSLKTIVNFEPLKGICFLSKSKALIHSFNDNKDLDISAPSILVYFTWS